MLEKEFNSKVVSFLSISNEVPANSKEKGHVGYRFKSK